MRDRFAHRTVVLLAGFLAAGAVLAQSRLPTVERFTARTTSMTPNGLELRIDVREWSDEAGRAAVVAALGAESDVGKKLTALPTVGYVWVANSGIGYAVKYAHRAAAPQGERVTFVTDRRIGSYESKPWTANAGSPGAELDYSVIELYLEEGKTGSGTLSLAADVQIDPQGSQVSLAADPPKVLAEAKEEPKPYWAKGDEFEQG